MIAILLFIFKFVAVVCFAALISLLTLFFDMIIQPGMIAHFYLRRLVYFFGKKNKEFAIIEQLPVESRFQEHFNYCFNNSFFFKMLGGCMPCTNVWHSIIISGIVLVFVHQLFACYWIIAVVLISSFYLRYLMTKV